MATIGTVLSPQMPKQVWQSEDGNTFETEEECVAYEKVAAALNNLFESGLCEEAEAELGMQDGFGSWLNTGVYETGQLLKYRASFQILADVLHGRVKLE